MSTQKAMQMTSSTSDLHEVIERIEKSGKATTMPLSEINRIRGLMLADNSGSTCGIPLTNMKNASKLMKINQGCLWNSLPGPIKLREDLKWISTGGTYPGYLVTTHGDAISNAGAISLWTDGQVDKSQINILSNQFETGQWPNNVPYILGISLQSYSSDYNISRLNVSVLLSAFECSQCCVLLVFNRSYTKLIAVKGPWARKWPNLPNLSDDPLLSEFPNIDIKKDINTLSVEEIDPIPPGCIQVFPLNQSENSIFHLKINNLLNISDASEIIEIFSSLSSEDAESIARYYIRLNQTKIIRIWIEKIQNMMEIFRKNSIKEVQSQSTESNDINSLIDQLNNVSSTDIKTRLEIIKKLGSSTVAAKEQEKTTSDNILSNFKQTRQFLSTILSVLADLEKASYGADRLGSKSNRAMRADDISADEFDPISSLHFNKSIKFECPISGEESTSCGILLSCVPLAEVDNNTGDFALNMPTAQYLAPHNTNRINNCLSNIEDGTCERLLTQFGEDPTTRRPVMECLPIISLKHSNNKKQIYLRLCNAFFGKKKMPQNIVWQLVLSIITWTINTCEWASPDSNSDMYKALHYFGQQILDNIYIYDGIRDGVAVPMKNAYAKSICEDVLTKDYPAHGTANILMTMILWNIVPKNGCSISNIATVSLHMEIVKQYQSNVKTNSQIARNILISKLFMIYANKDDIVDIAGMVHDIINFDDIIPQYIIKTFHVLAKLIGLVNSDDFIVSSTRLIIWACINCVTPNSSSSSAIEACMRYENLASEFNNKLVGLISDDTARNILREHRSWAEIPRWPVPGFATPYGPPLIYFCKIATTGETVNLLQLWEGTDNPLQIQGTELSDFVKREFDRHMDEEFDFSNGLFIQNKTKAYPLHKAMWITWNVLGIHPENPQYVKEVIRYLISLNKGNLHVDHLAKDICTLIPSLLAVGPVTTPIENAAIEGRTTLDRISFHDRLMLEINNRLISEIKKEPSPESVYYDEETIENMLEPYDLSDIHNLTSTTSVPLPVSATTTMKKISDNIMSRRLIKGLRHDNWNNSYSASFRTNGLVNVDEIIKMMATMNGISTSFEQMQRCERNCDKKRFRIEIEEDGTKLIGATQGHTVKSITLEASHIQLTEDRFTYAYHGTSELAAGKILKTELHSMMRNAIQMSIGKINDPEVISGMRTNVEVVLQINIKDAINDGIEFFISHKNNVIVTRGPIPAKYITILRDDDRFYS